MPVISTTPGWTTKINVTFVLTNKLGMLICACNPSYKGGMDRKSGL
jgi:hypothetical protein